MNSLEQPGSSMPSPAEEGAQAFGRFIGATLTSPALYSMMVSQIRHEDGQEANPASRFISVAWQAGTRTVREVFATLDPFWQGINWDA